MERRRIPGIAPSRDGEIRSLVSEELNKLWVMRHNFNLRTNDREALVRIANVAVPQCLFGFAVDHRQEIPPEGADFEIAGIIDRRARQIVVSQKFPNVVRRFTIAHEVGHLLLHPGRVYHRDRPLSGDERLASSRNSIEREADLFAAELLMPTKMLTEIFVNRFGGRIIRSKVDDELSHQLSMGIGRRFAPRDLKGMSDFELAKIVAEAEDFGPDPNRSLIHRFSVSKTAMAIQLLDLNLVS